MTKFVFAFIVSILFVSPLYAAAGDTRVAKWQNDAKAVFLLMVDDSMPSAFEIGAPELQKRGMTATFYICPGKGEYKVFHDKWENEVWRTGVVYGNHTLTHGGVRSVEHARQEIGQTTDAIYKIVPGKQPRLLSYAQPGVGPGQWKINKEQEAAILKENHLIDRPTFAGHGAVYHWQTAEQMLALADKAIASGGMEYLIIHGIERRKPMNTSFQDFWALNQDIYRAVLDGLKDRRDRGDLWITDHISYHQYLTERQTAKVQVLQADEKSIRLKLTSDADPQFYDHALTLVTEVPGDWKACQVAQGEQKASVTASDGKIQFDAAPGEVQITNGQ